MDGEIIAGGLEFPEGPVWLDGAIWFTEILGGHVSRWTPDGGVERVADTGGGPNGATAARRRLALRDPERRHGHGRSHDAGHPAGHDRRHGRRSSPPRSPASRLDGPNDLAFGPDGRLWFTDPRGDSDPAKNSRPGRIFALDVAIRRGRAGHRARSGVPERHRLPRRRHARVDRVVQPPGHAPRRRHAGGRHRAARAALPRRVLRRRRRPRCTSARRTPTASASSTDGAIVDKLPCADGMVTNCCFGGTDLYVTDSRNGTLWRFDVGVEGLPCTPALTLF